MVLKNIYERIFFREDKMDFKYDEAMEIYEREDALLIDVRTPDEYKEKHINGAINIPIYEIDNMKNEIVDKDKIILIYCKTGKRSKMAKEILMQNGYRNVYTFNPKL